ncbi:hypothetical protein DYB25_008246 [Aphanomyces astaci]|uniref:Endonuclease/exonuclease/phosphatase domain-containing protein n=1 Tax=Aphanomyces astaci TaxID=112090 RepID=A0A397BU20_APHAT|nr:hypothetical protein DYB25_008246 [Aphanomyces astaci]
MSHDHFPALPSELVDWDPQIISLNTNGFSNSHRYILQKLSSTHDVTFVQETRFRAPSLQDKVSYHWQRLTNHDGVVFFEPPLYPLEPTSPATGGLATLLHPHSPLKNAVDVPHDNPILRGRYLQVRCVLGPATIVLHNVYAPISWSERARFFDELPRDFPPHFLHIVGGDFNCTLNKDLDSLNPSAATMAGTDALLTWMRDLSIVDLFRQQNPLRKTFTSPKLINRLDYIFCSSSLARLAHWKAAHLPHIPHADHVACRIIAQRQTTRHGSGSWKAPPWLLRLPRAATIIHGCLDRFLAKSNGFHNVGKAYDILVTDIRQQLKLFHDEQLDKQRLPLKKLALEIAALLQVPNMRQDPVLVDRVRDLQQQIRHLHDQQKKFLQEQAFQLHLYKAERSSRFHFSSPIPTPLRKTVFKELEDANGNLVSDQTGVSNTLVDYYSDLFAAPELRASDDDLSAFLGPLTRDTQLSVQAQQELAAPLLANEFYHAIRHSSSNSAPGPNALPFEVLKLAPHKWSLVLELVFTKQLHANRVHTGSFFADDSQLYAVNEKSLHRQLALVQGFCDKSGFRLNVDKTQVLTYCQASPCLAPLLVATDSPTKALGILVAPHLTPKARFSYVFDKFIARLSLWCYKARTLAGKVAILHSICLPVMWYQLSFVPADKACAKLIDNAMLQFLHGEDINPSNNTHGLRLIKKDLVFMSKHTGGLGLHHALKLWQQHNRAVMIRCVKAFAVPSSKSAIPSWITPGYALLEKAFHPWGSPRDLLLAQGTSPFMKQFMKHPGITPMWTSLLSEWFTSRWTMFGFPSNAPSWTVPLWHNAFLPGLENLYDHCSASSQPQARTLASLGLTQVSHFLTPCHRLWPASTVYALIHQACIRSNLEPPTKHWITILMTKLSNLFEVVPEANPPPFRLPVRRPPLLEVSWILRPDLVPIELAAASSTAAKIRAPPVADSSLIPTKHLGLPADFYADPKRLKQLAVFSRPEHILPRYGEFVYKTLLRANAMQYLFQYRSPQPTCIFCGSNETYQHFLFACRYGLSVWHHFKRIQRALQCPFPRNAFELFFELPKPQDGYYVRGLLKIWPIVRACVYYQIWLQRADRTFRPDLTPKTPVDTAIHAANLIKMHLRLLLRDLPLKKGYSKVFNVLRALSADPWLKLHVIPDSVHA